MTAILNLVFLWWHEIINSPDHRRISRYPDSSRQRNYTTFYKQPFTHILRNWLHSFLTSSFSQSAASGLRKPCKTVHPMHSVFYNSTYTESSKEQKYFLSIPSIQESTEKEHITTRFLKKNQNPNYFYFSNKNFLEVCEYLSASS